MLDPRELYVPRATLIDERLSLVLLFATVGIGYDDIGHGNGLLGHVQIHCSGDPPALVFIRPNATHGSTFICGAAASATGIGGISADVIPSLRADVRSSLASLTLVIQLLMLDLLFVVVEHHSRELFILELRLITDVRVNPPDLLRPELDNAQALERTAESD